MGNKFRGFPKELFQFLRELSKNNQREWFQEHKSVYREFVVDPVCEFIAAMAPRLQKVSECFVADPRPNGGSMFRIYRDTRFSGDKRPYKENVGCHFRHMAGKDAHAPGFYVHLESQRIFFGGGVWMPPNPVLDKIRDAIVEEPSAWASIVQNKAFMRRFGSVTGDGLKRPPRGYAADHPFVEDLKRKSFYVIQEVEESVAQTPQFIVEVEKAFMATRPLMQFLTTALELPFERKRYV